MQALFYWSGRFFLTTGDPTSSRFLSSAQWDAVYADILRQCDTLDGVADGIIENPDLCHYNPESLICSPNNPIPTCLTGEQAITVRKVFSPAYDETNTLIYPRLQPGANSTARFLSGQPFDYLTDWFRYVVYNDPSWDPSTLSLNDYKAAIKQDPFAVSTWSGDLSSARSRGSKILHYHGLQDPVISSENSARYYQHVAQMMNLPPSELDEFYRYFRISGLGHCRGGDGAGQIGGNEDTFVGWEAEGNVLAAIVRWVEEGIAPERILGSSVWGDVKRGHCRWPGRNRFRGGDYRVPESWECV